MTANLSSQITRYGVSESFNALIDGLRETPGLSDKKFRLADVNKIAQYFVCRNYGKACLELSYLAWAVVNYPTKTITNAALLEFFWIHENITPARFRQAFEHPHKNNNYNICMQEDGLHLIFSQHSFIISPTRIGLLAVLLEVIVTLAPQQLNTIENTLKDTQIDSAIKTLSSVLQKQIYQFLAEHLVQAQQQRRFRYVSQWLDSNKSNEESLNTYVLNDEIILSFWQYAGLDESSPGYKLYASALNDVIDVHQAIQQTKQVQALDNAGSIGYNVEGGEYSPDTIQEILFNDSPNIQSYEWLCQSPKFLTKAQWGFIEPLVKNCAYGKTLALSFARLAIFGQWQANIVQAKRKSASQVQEKLSEKPHQNYQQYLQRLIVQKKIMTQVNMAIAYIFYSLQDSRYLGFVLDYIPKLEAEKIKSWVEQKISSAIQSGAEGVDFSNVNKMIFTQSQKALLQSQDFSKVMQLAKAAFNGNNKEGFQQLPDTDLLDLYQDGHDAVAKCQNIIQENITQLSRYWVTLIDCEENYCSDVSIFKGMFDLLYGEVNDQQ